MKTCLAWVMLLALGLPLSGSAESLAVPVEGVIYLTEHRLGMSLEKLGELLLPLARADKEGRFASVYQELLPQGLSNLVKVFADFVLKYFGLSLEDIQEGWPALERKFSREVLEQWPETVKRIFEIVNPKLERIPVFIRALSLEYKRALERPSRRERPLEPTVRLLNLLWNAFYSFIEECKLPVQWGAIRDWLDSGLAVFGFPNVRRAKHLDTQLAWRFYFVHWSTKFMYPETREKAADLIHVMYKMVDEAIAPFFASLKKTSSYHRLLKTLVHLEDLTFGHVWSCKEVSFINPIEMRLTFQRQETRHYQYVKDIAMVNFVSLPDSEKEVDEVLAKVFNWTKTTIKTITDRSDSGYSAWEQARVESWWPRWLWWLYHPRPKPGFDIVAVVINDHFGSGAVQKITKFVDQIAKEIPRSSEHGYWWISDPNDLVARAVLITWEEKIGTEIINWVSMIELGPGDISDEQKQRIFVAFAGPNYQEYIPTSSPTQTQATSIPLPPP